MFRAGAGLAMLLCSINVGCGGGDGAACMVNEDCPSRFCRADGTCGPVEVDGGNTDADSDPPIDAPTGTCSPNHDGNLTIDELPLMAGKSARFRIATDATFDTAGTPDGTGARRWDLTGTLANDQDQQIALASPSGAWWAADFPDASYAATLSAGSDLMGVFHVDDTGLTLLGVVSPTGGATETNLEYDPPVQVLALPMAEGDQWLSNTVVSGTAQGFVTAYSEKYTSSVDKVGTMKTPYGEFPVVRVATDLERTSGGFPIASTRSFAWMAECFGAVANATSQDAAPSSPSSEFTNPAEVKRIIP